MLVGWLGVAVAVLWPLPRYAATHIPATLGEFNLLDTLHAAWVNAHVSRALPTAPSSLLDTGTYHPEPRTLFYHTTALALVPFFMPTFLLTGNPILALNLAFLGCVALSTSAIHVVVWRWTGDVLAGAIAGWAFLATGTITWGFVAGAPFYAMLAPVPLIISAVLHPRSRLAAPVVLGPLVALQCLVDPLYVAPAVLGPVMLLALVRTRRSETAADGQRLLRGLAVACVLLAPVYGGYAEVMLRNPGLRERTVWGAPATAGGEVGSARLAGRTAAYLVENWYYFPVPVLALGLVATAWCLATVRRRTPSPCLRAWRHGAVWTSIALVLLPLLRLIEPALRGINRGGLVGLIALSMLTGFAFRSLTCGARARWRVMLAVGVIALFVTAPRRPGLASAFTSFPDYPVQPAPHADSALVAVLRQSSSPVVEVPAGTAAGDMAAQYRSLLHGRRVLNGYSSYQPAGVAERLALANELPNPTALAMLREQTGLGTVVIRWQETPPPRRRAWDRAIARGDFRVVARVEGMLVVDVSSSP